MKVLLDLDDLLAKGKITPAQHVEFSGFAQKSTGSLAFNILIGFGVISVSCGALALVPEASAAIVIGFLTFGGGLILGRESPGQWRLLANVCILVGALMAGGGIVIVGDDSVLSKMIVTAVFAAASIYAQSVLLAVLATLALSACIGAATAYSKASYFLIVQEPEMTVILFTLLGIGLYHYSKILAPGNEKIAIAASRTSVFLVNLGFWVGSLWGNRSDGGILNIPAPVFSFLWAAAIIATAVWAWKANRRWALNTVATFGGIHFYTQWFEHLGGMPGTVLIAGLLAIGFAIGLRSMNSALKDRA
jgi:iron complex transport system permease protein